MTTYSVTVAGRAEPLSVEVSDRIEFPEPLSDADARFQIAQAVAQAVLPDLSDMPASKEITRDTAGRMDRVIDRPPVPRNVLARSGRVGSGRRRLGGSGGRMSVERPFVTIPASHVDPELRRLARLAGEIGAGCLGIRKVNLRWVLPEASAARSQREGAARHVSPRNWSGWVYRDEPDTFYVRADMPEHVAPTVLHELRHLAQHRDGDPTDEDDAERWAQHVMQTPYYV